VANQNPILPPLADWLVSCTRKGKISRNTIAVSIVILHHLRQKCPLTKSDTLSSGGEIVGSRHGLAETLEQYGIPAQKYLKEVTTRQAHQDGQRLLEALDYGIALAALDSAERDAFLQEAIQSLVLRAQEWLSRQHFKLNLDRQYSPAAWIQNLLEEARGRSGGKVEQHLVGAKLEERHPDVKIPNHPGHAADVQTGRPGDFIVGTTAYHVTATPGGAVVRKCAANLAAGLHPILLVPRDQVAKARHIAEDQNIAARVTVVAIEDFIALNVVEMSKGEQRDFVSTLKRIVDTYNRRLEEVETDMSLKIEIQ
jgi:hypothetical protein